MNYIGSKHTLLPFIEETFEEVTRGETPRTFCDLFAGTGAVGRRFKQRGLEVTANDLQYYSFVLNRAYLVINRPLEFGGLRLAAGQANAAETALASVNELQPAHGFVSEQYSPEGGRFYFTPENAARIDGIRLRLEEWRTDGTLTEDEYYYLLCSLLEAADRVANTASVYGAYLKQFKRTALRPLQLRPLSLSIDGPACRVAREDANRLINEIECDVLYLDPPYNHRQYGANYHVLETIALGDRPEVRGTSGLREYPRSRYCRPAAVQEAFTELIRQARTQHILVSYNDEGLLSLEQIHTALSLRGEPHTFTRAYNRYKADNGRAYKRVGTLEHLHYVRVER